MIPLVKMFGEMFGPAYTAKIRSAESAGIASFTLRRANHTHPKLVEYRFYTGVR